MRSRNSRRSSAFSTRSIICRFISVVTARLMVDLWVRVQWAMYCALQASIAETQRRQHAPFRNVEPVTRLIFGRERGGDFGRQPVQPERHELEEVETRAVFCGFRWRSVLVPSLRAPLSGADRDRALFSLDDALAKIAPI